MKKLQKQTLIGMRDQLGGHAWSDAEITELYYAMREIGAEYAAIMHWRDGGEVL